MTARPGDQAGGWTFNRPAEGTSDGWLADRAGVTAEIVITADVVAARRLATLDHPSLPRVLDVQEHGSTWLIALEATDDRPLHEVAMGGGLPDEVVVALARSVSEALALAHGAGVVHGRLTPEAVRVDAQGRVKIHDLLAPTEHDAGPDDDAWRLGWCIWVLCTGAQDPPPRPGPLDPGPTRSEVLRACVAGLTEPDPDQRWTPAAAAEALRRSEAQRTIGRYRLGRELGRGGMGVVFDAYDPDLDRPVALKLMAGGRFGDPTAVRRFLAEARAVARLSHPDIVPVLDIGESQDGPFFTMARIEGRTLTEELASRGRIPWRQATAWLVRVARALHHAHTRGIVHRDVKPGNVMLEAGTEPRVLDFGLALDVDRTTTVTVGVIGTPAYMAPEQAAGERGRVGPRTDVYALGVMLHELLSGEPAFHGRSPVAVLTAVAQ
ncbi:MAG TPA: serine/threonine-protein kinase, partial [Myxococcota bacterium]|nr:serine/threonine-protein kinase [Myxococcota bacterium]